MGSYGILGEYFMGGRYGNSLHRLHCIARTRASYCTNHHFRFKAECEQIFESDCGAKLLTSSRIKRSKSSGKSVNDHSGLTGYF